MPTPKLFKKFSSKSNNSSEDGPTPDVLAHDEKDDAQTFTETPDGPIPGYSDSLKEAWAVTHQELPQTQRTEKFLNKIGTLIITFGHP